jgi:hypothetical protein
LTTSIPDHRPRPRDGKRRKEGKEGGEGRGGGVKAKIPCPNVPFSNLQVQEAFSYPPKNDTQAERGV